MKSRSRDGLAANGLFHASTQEVVIPALTIVACDLEKLIFEVRVQSPLAWYQNCYY